MLRAASALLPLALAVRGAGAARQLRALERRSALALGQPPGDVGGITGPVNVVGTLGQGIASAVGEVQAAAAQVSQPFIQDPQAALAGTIGAAESVMQNLVPGRGLVTDVLAKSAVAPPTPAPALASGTTAASQTTYPPAPFNGVYCRGAACQYRRDNSEEVAARAKAGVSEPVEPPDESGVSQKELAEREFCRGLGCLPGSGHPPDAGKEHFVGSCVHLLVSLGGLQGDDESRGVLDVHESVLKACRLRVDVHEAGFCADYADVFAAALSPLLHQQTVGDARQVCASTLSFMHAVKTAEVDLQLFEADPPSDNSSSVPAPSAPSKAASLFASGQAASLFASGGQGGGEEESRARAQPASGKAASLLASGGQASGREESRAREVEIVPGSPDGVLPPVSVGSKLFATCTEQHGLFTKGQAVDAAKTVRMAKEWCAWQTILTSWDDVKGKKGQAHPEWTGRTCLGIVQLMAFALREDMESRSALSAKTVCKKLFLASGAVYGVDRLVENALLETTRGLPARGLALPSGDPAMRKLAEDAKRHAEAVSARLQHEKQAAEALKAAK